MKKILVIQTAFIGDVILATPIASELTRLYPNSKIDFLVKKGNEFLTQNNPNINKTWVFDKKQKIKNIIEISKKLKKEKYDLIINLHRYASSAIIGKLSCGNKLYGFDKNPLSFLYSKKFKHDLNSGLHEVERNLSIIKEFGANKLSRPSLHPTETNFRNIHPYLAEDFICIAPASVWYTKQLPIHKWVELINKNLESKIYLIGGPNDSELCNIIIEKSIHKNIENLCGKLSLLDSAALIHESRRIYVNDSGPLHIASAMNTPVTAFFCSTIPQFGFGPLSEDSVIKEVKQLECRPCGIHGYEKCPKNNFKCGEIDL